MWNWVVKTMLDETAVREGYRRLAQTRDSQLDVLQQERRIYAEQHDKTRQEIDTLLVLYRTSKVKLEYLDAHIEPLQEATNRLQTAIAEVDKRIAELDIADEDLTALLTFAAQIKERVAEFNFEQRRHLIELLNVRVELAVEEGRKVLYVTSRVDSVRLQLEVSHGSNGSTAPGMTSRPTRSESGSFELLTTRSSRASGSVKPRKRFVNA